MDKKYTSLREIEKAYIRTQGLQRVTAELAKAATKSDVAKIIVEEGFTVLHADSGDIALLGENNEFEVLGSKGYPKSFLNIVPSPVQEPQLLTLYVIETKKPYFIPDVNKLEKRYEVAKKFIQKVKAKSAALLPLTLDEQVMGVIQFTFKESQEFEEEDKKFMMTLAQQCAQAFERVIAQDALAESKKELEIILSTVADGILVQDKEGKIIYANNAVGKVFKEVSLKDIFSKPWEEFLSMFEIQDEKGNVIPYHLLAAQQALVAKKHIKVTHKFTHKRTGETHWLQIESSPIIGVNKKSSIIVSVFQDITVLKEIEQRKDDFISMASHELKTPLTSAKVFTHVLKQRMGILQDELSTKMLAKLDRQLDLLNELTKDLLDITKLQKGKLDLSKSRFMLDKVVQEIVGDLQPSTDHPLRISTPPQLSVIADKEKISQVITNFLTNAIKYSNNTTTIKIAVRKNTHSMIVSVKDEGIGISKEDVEKIFERFYRIERERKTYPGLGLGLYISSEIIKQHGGKIWVKSEKGKGSTFYFSLPIKVLSN